MKKLALILIAVFICFSLFSQNGSSFKKPLTFKLEGTITDINDSLPIKNAVVRLIGTDSSDIETRTDSLGFYSFKLKHVTSYTIIVSAEKYLTSRGQETTLNLEESTKFIHNFKMQPTKTCVMPFPLVIFKPNSFEGVKTSNQNIPSDSLYFIIATLKTNPTLVFGITGYRDSTEKVNTSIKRAKWVKAYLVKNGINKNRLRIFDGGIREEYINKRIVVFHIISDDFHLK